LAGASHAISATEPAAGCPSTISVNQEIEFVSRDLDIWAYAKGVTLDFSRRSKPKDNAYIEHLDGKFALNA